MSEAQKLIDKYGFDDSYFACINLIKYSIDKSKWIKTYYEIEKIETEAFLEKL
mgnify:FL=1